MSLRELQERFLGALREPEQASGFLGEIVVVGDPAARLRVHRRSMIGALVDALSEAYPVCRRLVGSTFFDAMARRYVAENPSRTPDLHVYGELLSAFLERFTPAAELPYLPDVARLEWAWHRAQLSPEATRVDLAFLGSLSEESYGELRFEATPSLWQVRSPLPILRIWTVNQPGWEGSETVDLADPGDAIVVWNTENGVRLEALADARFELLAELTQGGPLGALSDGAVADLEEGLSHLLAQGWLRPISTAA
jgi:hypothetical protein